jgi:putative ABC transport system permease protein
MVRLAIRTMRSRAGGFLASLVALFLGALVVQACGGLLETGILSHVPAQRLAATAVVVSGDQSYPGHPSDDSDDPMTERVLLHSGLTGVVAAVPGVAAAVPDVSVPLTAGSVPASGHGWSAARLAPYTLSGGTAPAGAGDVVLDTATAARLHVHPGASLAVAVRGAQHTFRVTGLVHSPHATQPALLFTDAEATRLYDRPGRIDDIGVLATAGTDPGRLADRIDAALAGRSAVTLTGDDRGLAEFPEAIGGSSDLVPLAGAFGGLAVLVSIFVVVGTIALQMQQRRREMALLRTIGAAPAQLRRMVMTETVVLAVVAGALALAPGLGVGRWMYGVLVHRGLVPGVLEFSEGFVPRISGFGVTLVAALAAAYIASRRVSRVRPTEALAEATLQTRWLHPVRFVLAALCLGGATALVIVTALVMTGPIAASTSAPAAMLWAGGIALVSPGLCRWLAALLQWPIRLVTGLSGRMAMLNAGVRRVRLAAAVTPIMLVTGLATALIYLQTSQDDASDRAFSAGLRADAVVTSTTGALPPSLVDAFAGLPQVAGASASVFSDGHLETELGPGEDEDGDIVQDRVADDELPLQGVSASGAVRTIATPAVSGSFADLTGDTIALPTDVTAQAGRHVGDTVRLRWGDGQLSRVTVVASFVAPRGFDSALVPATTLLPHTTSGELPQILVQARPGVSAADLATALRRAGGDVPGLAVADRAVATAAHEQSNRTGAAATLLLAAVIIGYAAISLINTLIVATTDRRAEFGLQRLIGSTRGQVLRMVAAEAGVTSILGVVLGTAVAAGALIPFGLALDRTVLPSGPLWIYLAITGTAVVLTFLMTLLPASLTLRGGVRPAV